MPFRSALVLLAAPVLALSAAGVAMAGQDRYGPPMRPEPDAAEAAAPATYLSWPGKVAVAAPSAPATVAQAAPARARAQPRAQDQEPLPPALAAMRAPQRPLPASIYAPAAPSPQLRPAVQAAASPMLRPAEAPAAYRDPPPKPAPVRTAAVAVRPHPAPAPAAAQPSAPAPTAVAASADQGGMPAHFYSVQREFGLKPDPIPLPNQFFADGSTGDLAGPPPPPPPHLIPGQSASSAANVQRAQSAADMADPDAPPSN